MRALAVALLVLAFACGKKAADDDKPSGPRRQITYEIDLDRAIDDKAWDLRADLEAALAAEKIEGVVIVEMTPLGGLAIVPAAAPDRIKVDAIVKSSYGDTVVARECNVTRGPNAICIAIAPAYGVAVKKAALGNAVKTIRARLDELKVKHHTVVEKGDMIVVEFPVSDDDRMMTIRDVIARTGKLEFKVVDNDSPYMKKVFATVGYDGPDGKPTDPRAIAVDIRAEVDQWRADDAFERQNDYFLIAYDREEMVPAEKAGALGCFKKPAGRDGMVACQLSGRRVIERYIEELGMADPSFKLPDDRELGFEQVEPWPDAKDRRPYWRSYYLERAPRLTGRAVSNAQGTFDPNMNRPLVLLDFNREGTRVFGELTAQIAGKKLATVLDGRIRSAPIVNGPIRGGRASITMGGTDAARQEAERDELVTVLKTGSLPAPLREAFVADAP